MNEEHELKSIPYGISDFENFRKKDLYYVDKTRFIRDIEGKGSFLFFIRPRRFGKSLFLSMMEYYYDIERKDEFDYLFSGTDIHNRPTKERNEYLVFPLNFSMVNSNPDLVEGAFLTRIKNAANMFIAKYQKYLDVNPEKAENEFNSKKSASEIMDTLLSYCWSKKQRIYVIIDEYDNFANTILSDSGTEKYEAITHGEGFFRSFFNVIKGGATGSGTPISRLFMTGVSPITLDDVTSGFNIATNISLDSDINEMLGFTKTEVEIMIEYYRQTGKIKHSTPELMEIMSRWYNHYRFSPDADTEVYSTVHVLFFIREYLKKSKIPNQLIDFNARIDYNKLRKLIIIDKQNTRETNGNFSRLLNIIETGSVHSTIETGFPSEKLTQPKYFISLLYYFGLLTFDGIDDEDTPILSIPNEMVKQLYYSYIIDTYDELKTISFNQGKYLEQMRGMAYKGKWEEAIRFIAGYMESALSLRDLVAGEKIHQTYLNIFLGLSTLYNVYSEREMNQGYADLVLEPLIAQNPGIKFSYIIELKTIKASDLEKEDNEDKDKKNKIQAFITDAHNQLSRYSSDEKFLKTIGKTTLKKLVLIFSGNRIIHQEEV